MTEFEYFSVLISIVVAMVLSELFSGWGRLLRKRQRVRFSRLHAAWCVFLVVYTVQFWHGFWQYRVVEDWGLTDLLQLVFETLLLVVLAQLSVPEVPDAGSVDLSEHYMRQAPWVFSVMGLLLVSVAVGDATIGGQPFWHGENAMRAAGLGVCAGLAASRSERFHAALFTLGLGFFASFLVLRWQAA